GWAVAPAAGPDLQMGGRVTLELSGEAEQGVGLRRRPEKRCFVPLFQRDLEVGIERADGGGRVQSEPRSSPVLQHRLRANFTAPYRHLSSHCPADRTK